MSRPRTRSTSRVITTTAAAATSDSLDELVAQRRDTILKLVIAGRRPCRTVGTWNSIITGEGNEEDIGLVVAGVAVD